ncbi:nuclear factor NF4 [Cardiosporidium cionae]|uniref:Nuclear factor NF4 n=1 Tax=Cardiosporidium cionae TaxID=476202 RepID=A0ABQ7JFZ3_9APIC|nr:nuclear factor NF4 [Cardiosporidium cionae]|eukprot:KAF8822936.1 nuclear factor NF4 [Cardiosporidium cionae]
MAQQRSYLLSNERPLPLSIDDIVLSPSLFLQFRWCCGFSEEIVADDGFSGEFKPEQNPFLFKGWLEDEEKEDYNNHARVKSCLNSVIEDPNRIFFPTRRQCGGSTNFCKDYSAQMMFEFRDLGFVYGSVEILVTRAVKDAETFLCNIGMGVFDETCAVIECEKDLKLFSPVSFRRLYIKCVLASLLKEYPLPLFVTDFVSKALRCQVVKGTRGIPIVTYQFLTLPEFLIELQTCHKVLPGSHYSAIEVIKRFKYQWCLSLDRCCIPFTLEDETEAATKVQIRSKDCLRLQHQRMKRKNAFKMKPKEINTPRSHTKYENAGASPTIDSVTDILQPPLEKRRNLSFNENILDESVTEASLPEIDINSNATKVLKSSSPLSHEIHHTHSQKFRSKEAHNKNVSDGQTEHGLVSNSLSGRWASKAKKVLQQSQFGVVVADDSLTQSQHSIPSATRLHSQEESLRINSDEISDLDKEVKAIEDTPSSILLMAPSLPLGVLKKRKYEKNASKLKQKSEEMTTSKLKQKSEEMTASKLKQKSEEMTASKLKQKSEEMTASKLKKVARHNFHDENISQQSFSILGKNIQPASVVQAESDTLDSSKSSSPPTLQGEFNGITFEQQKSTVNPMENSVVTDSDFSDSSEDDFNSNSVIRNSATPVNIINSQSAAETASSTRNALYGNKAVKKVRKSNFEEGANKRSNML